MKSDGEVTVLMPSLAEPIGMVFASAFLCLLGVRTMQMGGLGLWWAALPLIALGSALAAVAIRGLRNRRQLRIEIDCRALSFGEGAVTRKEVVKAAYHKDILFKGVRIDLREDKWMAIPHHFHSPRRVLAALKSHGYPTEE